MPGWESSRIQTFVGGYQGRVFPLEEAQEMVLCAFLEVEGIGPQEAGTVVGGRTHHLLQILGAVGDAGYDGGQNHPGCDSHLD